MEHARPPPELAVEGGPASRSDAWRTWRKQFSVFLKASGVAKEPADVQASLLINLIGPAGYEVFTTFTYGKGESEDDIECLLKKFDEHFGTKPNVTLARFKFFTRSQDSSETIDLYVTALRVLSQYCEFAQLRDSLIRDRIVCGISSNTVRDRLLRTEDLTLAKAVQICEAAEMSKEESRVIEASTAEASVDAIWKESGRGGASGSRPGGGGGGRRRLRGARAARVSRFASLTLTDTQTRYAQIEKEMLAIVFAVERFRQYLFGRRDITVQSDHKPLEALCSKPLASVPIRLQRMMMRIQGYDLKVVYTPGKYMYIADTLSRAALPELMNDRISTEVESQTCFLIENIRFSDEKLELVKKHITSDAESKLLISYITNGWPKHKKNIKDNLRLFWQYRNLMQYANGLIFKSDVLYIPPSLRKLMLERVHEGHLGIDRCKRRARDVMFWPGLSRDVEHAVRGCAACALHAPAPRPMPLNQHYVPNIPWQKLGSDIFEYKKKHYIILIDYFSNYVEVGMIKNLNSTSVIKFLREQFARHGVPLELITDNATAYSSREFKKFMSEWEVRHVTSSPHYPQSNGKSERTVQTIKLLLKKCIDSGQDFYVSLLNYRTTSRDGMDSPAQILMGRRLNTKLPINHKLLREKVDTDANYSAVLGRQKEIQQNFDRRATPLRDLSAGEKVILADGASRKPVSVVGRAPEPRSYFVRDEQGRVCRRTRRHLIARTAPTSATTSSSHTPQKATTDRSTPTKIGVMTRKRANLLAAQDKNI